jgi:hypothetical protein
LYGTSLINVPSRSKRTAESRLMPTVILHRGRE